jgi:hypothetical protein
MHFSRIARPWIVSLGVMGIATSAFAAKPVDGPEINPYACQGRAEVAQADRSISQIEDELEKKLNPVLEGWEPATERAIKYCTIGELKKRVGHGDAADWYAKAIAENPDEPGYEFFLGRYYGGARGARGTVVEMAEKHYYRALDKLEKLKEQGRYREHHKVIEDHTRKGLLTLYQQDGLPLLPWKAFPQHSNGYYPPGVSVGGEFHISKDTRDGAGANEMGGFAAEAGLRNFRVPAEPITEREKYDIARNPVRMRYTAKARLRQTYFGALDFSYTQIEAKEAAIPIFATPSAPKTDVNVKEMGVGYERNIPLYPLFDFKLAGGVRRVERTGTVEYFPEHTQEFNVYEVKPALSRFIGSDKLTLGYVFVYMDIPDLPDSITTDEVAKVRGRTIWAANVEYAFYSPLLLPSLHYGSLRPYRTPTRGFYLNAGYVNDNEVFGDHRTINQVFFAGARVEGPGMWNVGLTESFYIGTGYKPDIDTGVEIQDANISGKSLRSQLTIVRLLVNPDATPGVPKEVGPFASDTLNLAFPISFDKTISGVDYYENIRAGAQLWWKVYSTGIWGATFLTTVGYDYQYFYHINKHMHNAGLTVRLGWGDL